MSDWSEDTTLSFLEAYQNEQCIWNARDANHKNRQKVNDAWMHLTVIMKKSVKELKKKKEILMATFRRHLKRKQDSVRSGAGADDIYKPNWYAYELMESFLGPAYTSTKNINIQEETSSQEIPNKTAAIEEEDGEDNDLAQPSTSFDTPKPVTSRRRPATDLAERQMSSAFGQLTNILTKRLKERSPPTKEDDDCELYAKLLAKKLRELSPDDRKLFMYDIDTLFINRIKENIIRRQTQSSHYSVPYQSYSIHLPNASSISNRPSTSRTSYSEPLPNTSLFPNRTSSSQTSYSEPSPNTSPFPNRPSSSQTSYSEPSPNTSPFPNRPSSSQTLYSEPLPNTSPFPNRPSSSQTSYSEPLPNTSPFPNRPSSSQTLYSEPLPNTSPFPNRPSSSQTSYSEPLPNTSPFPNRPSSSQTSYSELLPNTSPFLSRPSSSQTSYSEPLPNTYITDLNQPSTLINYATPTIQIISNELIAPRTGQNIINEALLKAYKDFDCEK